MRLPALIAGILLSHTMFAQSAAPFDLQGHRGCRGLMPENSIPAFKKALDLGVTTLELDVVISQDRQVVVSHEPYMNAAYCLTPGGQPVDKKSEKNLNLFRMTYDQIKQYDCGSAGNPSYPEQEKIKVAKPLLKDVIREAEAYRKSKNLPPVSFNIEIKSDQKEYGVSQPAVDEFSDLVHGVIAEQLPAERVILQSFDFNVLKHWKKEIEAGRYRKVRLAALVSNQRSWETHLDELGFVPDVYSPNHLLLGKTKIQALQKRGIQVIPWTVNDAERMKKLKNWGVDGLITDYPDRAKGL